MNAQERLLQPREIILLLALLSFGLSLRLIKISQPFVDHWSWRQADVAMIAENFYRYGFNIFYPQINWARNAPGYVGTEFPLVPYIASLFYVFFGIREWVGRLVSVFFFAASVPFLYLLVRKISNQRSALFAAAIYAIAPLSIFASRSFMPDMTSLSFSIAVLYLFAEWLEREKSSRLFTAVSIATSLAILVKLPAIIIGLPLLYMVWEKYGARFVLRRELWVFAALSLIFPLVWYSHAYLTSISHPPHHMFGSGGMTIEGLAWYGKILHQVMTSSLTPIVFAAMAVGITLPPRAKFGRVFHWWLVAILLFVFLTGWGHRHQWYHLPIVPVAAVFAGLACDFMLCGLAKLTRTKTVPGFTCFVFFIVLAYLSYFYVKPLYEPWGMPFLSAGSELNHISPPDALVIVADDGDPTTIYYSGRKGWHFLRDFGSLPVDSQQAINELEKLRKEGASYLVFPQYAFWWFDCYKDFRKHLDSLYRRVSVTDEYLIFDLTVTKAHKGDPACEGEGEDEENWVHQQENADTAVPPGAS
jgi:hypothetical protein